MNTLICKICNDSIGTVDLDNLSAPLKPAMFGPLKEGYPFPFNVMSSSWDHCFCPLCKNLAIEENQIIIHDGNEKMVVDMVKEGGYEVSPFIDKEEQAAIIARETQIQYSAIVAMGPGFLHIIPQEQVSGVENPFEDGFTFSSEVESDGNIKLVFDIPEEEVEDGLQEEGNKEEVVEVVEEAKGWMIVTKETQEQFEFEGEETSGLKKKDAEKVLARIRSKGNPGLALKEVK